MDDLLGDYHDNEWGRPLSGVQAHFERVCLEAFQAGLSWRIILSKRPAFRAAFADFDPERVARLGAKDVKRLVQNPGIVRNRAKIEAAITNAQATLNLGDQFPDILWSFAPEDHQRPGTDADIAAVTPESTAMSKHLKSLGFKFVGPTTCYALMQAAGIVNDHLVGCEFGDI
jgi:DNA-3-methyladenine glycosylase I